MDDETPLEKPACWSYANASAFEAPSVARAYRHRAPYPPETFAILTGLIADTPRRVLDAGCGPGPLARPLAALVDSVDALDLSAAMVAEGRDLPGGDRPNLHWLVGRAEDAPLQPPYALITTGDSLHWMDWEVVLPRFARLLTPRGLLALVHNTPLPPPWADALTAITARYSTIRNWAQIDLTRALTQRGLLRILGEQRTAPVPFTQPFAAYLDALHSQSSLSRDRMAPAAVAAFDAAVRALVTPHLVDGAVRLQAAAHVTWGIPLAP